MILFRRCTLAATSPLAACVAILEGVFTSVCMVSFRRSPHSIAYRQLTNNLFLALVWSVWTASTRRHFFERNAQFCSYWIARPHRLQGLGRGTRECRRQVDHH